MNSPQDDPRARLRRSVYLILIAVGTGAMLGRILALDSVDQLALQKVRTEEVEAKLMAQRESLVKKGLSGEKLEEAMRRFVEARKSWNHATLRRPMLSANDRSRWCTIRALVEEDLRVEGAPYAINKVIQQPTWDTIDMVEHDGQLYSSKPPLLPTILAGEYWLIHRLTGLTLGDQPYYIVRLMLVTINVVPLVIYFLLLAGLVERFGTSDWGRLFVMAAAVFGTFLTTFAVTLNNHLPAAVSAMIALCAAIPIWFDGERRWRYFILAGLFGAFAVANELPAASLLGLLSLVLLWKAPKQTLLIYTPAVLVVAAGFFGTNWIAHHSLRPPYLHRNLEDPEDNWYDYTYEVNGRPRESYWNHPVGVDRGEPSRGTYAMHVLVGHHGIFSLTPVFLLSVVGAGLWLARRDDPRPRQLAGLIVVVSLVCMVFYLTRPEHHRNYGGVTSGLRWMFWLAPLWLVTMVPAADAMARSAWTRWLGLALLAASVLSASYPTWNPWTQPWIMDYLQYLGWIG